MPTQLVERIKEHEAQCNGDPLTSFTVTEVVELADGVLAVREADGEHTIYFDQTKYRVPDGAFSDLSAEIPHFPAATGFIEDVTARSWEDIQRTAQMALEKVDGGKIGWHDEPVNIEY